MGWEPLDETIAVEQVGHSRDHEQMHEWANNDFDINWGWCYVHPNGSNSYDGSNRRFPKATLEGAKAAGFNDFRLGWATYSVNNTMSFTVPPRVVGERMSDPRWRYGSGTTIRTSSTLNRIFDIDSGGVSYGGLFQDLKFYNTDITSNKSSSAIRIDNVNGLKLRRCTFSNDISQTTQRSNFLLLASNSARSGGSNNHIVVDNCHNHRSGLIASNTANVPQYGWRFFGCAGSGQSGWQANRKGAEVPFVDIQDGWPVGWWFEGNSWELIAANTNPTARVYINSSVQVDSVYIVSDTYERVYQGAYGIWLNNASNCLIEWRKSEATCNVRVNSTDYSAAPPDSGNDYFAWTDNRNNRIIINDRVYDW